jgi:hypothetical protein
MMRSLLNRVCLLLVLIAGAPLSAEPATSQEMRLRNLVFAGDNLTYLRQTVQAQKWNDESLRKRIGDREKGYNVVLFEVTYNAAVIDNIKVSGVSPNTISPEYWGEIAGSSPDAKKLATRLRLPASAFRK